MSVTADEKIRAKGVRLYMDGCFDLTHYGHANASRSAKELGGYLIVGIHSDYLITKNKGPPVFTEQERYKLARAIRWVDEVHEDAPYMNPISLLDDLNVDFLVHGDDLSFTADGRDTHEHLRRAGRFKNFKRTDGVSTTYILDRILSFSDTENGTLQTQGEINEESHETFRKQPTIASELLAKLSTGNEPRPNAKVVYVPGSWDVFHVGHLAFLEAAAKEGDYLIAGVYSDSLVRQRKGPRFPILSAAERAVFLLSLRCVNDVVVGVSDEITPEFLTRHRVSLVVRGQISNDSGAESQFKEVKRRGFLKVIDSGSSLTTSEIVARVQNNRFAFMERNSEKFRKDEEALIIQKRLNAGQSH